MTAGPEPRTGILLGPFRVTVDDPAVRDFSGALQLTETREPVPDIPLTFPIRWLALPNVREAIANAVSVSPGAVVHESQSFDYSGRLERSGSYELTVEVFADGEQPERVRLRGLVTNGEGREIVRLDTALRFFATSSGTEQSR